MANLDGVIDRLMARLQTILAHRGEPKNAPVFGTVDPHAYAPGVPPLIDVTGEGKVFCQPPGTMRMNAASRVLRQVNNQRNPPPVNDDPWAAVFEDEYGRPDPFFDRWK